MDTKKETDQIETVGVIGLGFMGAAIAANIVKEGFSVFGYDILKEKVDLLVENGGTAVSSAQEVAQKAAVVIEFV